MSKLWLGGFLAVTSLIFYYFVYGQWYLVSSTPGFIVLVVVFVSLSFLTSAIEAAFSKAHLETEIQDALDAEAAALAKRYEEFNDIVRNGGGIEHFTASQQKTMKKLERANRRLKRKRQSLEEESRSIYVGTFASLSVFLNIALAAVLPYALLTNAAVQPIGLQIITWANITPAGITFTWSQLDLSGHKVLVFFATSFPILVFGKILPKEIGVLFVFFFAYRLNFVARTAVFWFGFIPKALSWPLECLRSAVRPRA